MSEAFPLISVSALLERLAGSTSLCLLDARSDPADGSAPGRGRQLWEAGHLPGARHVDLDTDLSDHRRRGEGRHPMPHDRDFAVTLGRLGIGPNVPVVVYDAHDGSLAAARAWWMLRAIGHTNVCVLDGGVAAWLASGQALEQSATPHQARAPYPGRFDRQQLLDTDQVLSRLSSSGWLVDARAAGRFAGQVEPIDPVAGHIPGAVNLPYGDLVMDGYLLPPAQLRERIVSVVGKEDMHGCAVMCGSGVTACHVLLAMACAGLEGAALYAASWSGWIDDPRRPVAKGQAQVSG